MLHREADQTLAVERYLLGDMPAPELEEFEDHLFQCSECSESVKSGTTFVENARAIFSEPSAPPRPEPARPALRVQRSFWRNLFAAPAFVPALAALALLCVAGYQQLVVIRGLRTQIAELTVPQPLASFALHAASRGAEQTIVVPSHVSFFDLRFDVAVESASGYSCAILDEVGSSRFTQHLQQPGSQADGTLHLLIGRSRFPAGNYTVVISTDSQPGAEIGRYPFRLEYR